LCYNPGVPETARGAAFRPAAAGFGMDEQELKAKLIRLKQEHRDLDDAILALDRANTFDQLQMKRLKKKKLQLKDEISKIEDKLLPDIIA
jgi:hypothetical protein